VGAIEAVYSQRVKIGLTSKTFDEYLDECLGRNSHRFDLRRRFGLWRAAFGRHLAVRPFRADCLVGGDAVADFWHVAKLGSPPKGQKEYPNRRPGARELAVLRAVSASLERRGANASIREALAHAEAPARAAIPVDDRSPR
jgi:hypothetical protein